MFCIRLSYLFAAYSHVVRSCVCGRLFSPQAPRGRKVAFFVYLQYYSTNIFVHVQYIDKEKRTTDINKHGHAPRALHGALIHRHHKAANQGAENARTYTVLQQILTLPLNRASHGLLNLSHCLIHFKVYFKLKPTTSTLETWTNEKISFFFFFGYSTGLDEAERAGLTWETSHGIYYT